MKFDKKKVVSSGSDSRVREGHSSKVNNGEKPKVTLFESDVDDDCQFHINEDYAKKYDKWREKEEYQKLKDRHGVGQDSDTSSSEDDVGYVWNQDFEKEFCNALACLKKRDASIYDKKHSFFSTGIPTNNDGIKKPKNKKKSMFLKDYEREMLLNGNAEDILGETEDDKRLKEELQRQEKSPTYVEEQKLIKESFRNALEVSNEDDELFVKRKKLNENVDDSQEELETGKKNDILLKNINNVWTGELDAKEEFLRDYLVNQKFLNDEEQLATLDVNSSSEESESIIAEEEQKFKSDCNYRFEEPDQEYIKRFPRTIAKSLRKKDEKRKSKRTEIKARKLKEKEQKRNEIKRLKAMKRKEIQDRIETIKKVTGNTTVSFDPAYLEKDFDPTEYDQKMNQVFGQDYYSIEENEEPVMPADETIDDLEENWDSWQNNKDSGHSSNQLDDTEDGTNQLHCEDPDFNMDCDYDPNAANAEHALPKKSKRFRRGKLAAALKRRKPIYDPSQNTFENYLDEYYKLDYEDNIGDLLCRFKYRQVVPNNFGLDVEEILAADDKELNKWCSLKKVCQHRTQEEEKYDVKAYKKKARDVCRKANILHTVYHRDEDDGEGNKKDKNEAKKTKVRSSTSKSDRVNSNDVPSTSSGHVQRTSEKVKRKQFNNFKSKVGKEDDISDSRLKAYGLNPKRFKQKKKYGKKIN